MKRVLTLSILTAACAIVAAQDASAWINSNFGIGLNWSWQSGGNDLFWGLWHDGQPCGPDIMHQAVPVYPKSCCNCQQIQYVPVQVCNPCCNNHGPAPYAQAPYAPTPYAPPAPPVAAPAPVYPPPAGPGPAYPPAVGPGPMAPPGATPPPPVNAPNSQVFRFPHSVGYAGYSR